MYQYVYCKYISLPASLPIATHATTVGRGSPSPPCHPTSHSDQRIMLGYACAAGAGVTYVIRWSEQSGPLGNLTTGLRFRIPLLDLSVEFYSSTRSASSTSHAVLFPFNPIFRTHRIVTGI
jgi:hypothetical protein